MSGNNNLNKAKDAKNDEFYTQMEDIVAELRHYRKHFKGKTVLCNCDDPYESNFFRAHLKTPSKQEHKRHGTKKAIFIPKRSKYRLK